MVSVFRHPLFNEQKAVRIVVAGGQNERKGRRSALVKFQNVTMHVSQVDPREVVGKIDKGG